MAKNFILEIGTEELPPSCMDEGSAGLKSALENNLKNSRIKFESIRTFVSSRRIAAYADNLDDFQSPVVKTVTGPPKSIAFDENGEPNKAATGFAKSLGVQVCDLEEIDISGKGIYLGKRMKEDGRKTAELLPGIIRDTVLSLTFKKQMYWGDYDIRFARPIRWLAAVYGSKVIDFEIGTVRSSNITYGLRKLYPEPLIIDKAENYFSLLKKRGGVIASPGERRSLILEAFSSLENERWKGKYHVVADHELMDDVVNLVENPHIIAGRFPEQFLYIPKDILIEAIQYHQKYFAVISENGDVTTDFIIVANGIRDEDKVRRGNERVLRARLSDASFFLEEDRKCSFSGWRKKLDGVIFYSGIGTMGDKQKRLEKLTCYLAGIIKNRPDLKNEKMLGNLKKASSCCKCDLVTNMVVEFPELQGIVGKEYAREKGENPGVANAIFEHYQPRFAGDGLPVSETGRILSIADKIDTITGMFLAGNIPSGSEDPFALRRKASGIVLSTLEGKYDYELKDLIIKASELYLSSFDFGGTDMGKAVLNIMEFIMARYRFLLTKKGKRLDILDAVLGSGCSSIVDIDKRYSAIEKFIEKGDINKIYLPMFRSKNIIAKKEFGEVRPELFLEKYEKELYDALLRRKKGIGAYLENGKYPEVMDALREFGSTVDKFFDEVLVMAPEENLMRNRINLVRKIVDLYLDMADFSKLVITAAEE
ncbi:MAG: glycine--tRNA ligase subunit beta [Actinobacteria bacterium]|nr:glycine--tRNA ligase subunit beta [Actinomycetota bacterium]